jgi:hypothetical protein
VRASTAYLRPTSDNGPLSGVYGCHTAVRDASQPLGGSFSTAYSGKSGAGPTGSSAAATVEYADSLAQTWDQDIFGMYSGAYGYWQSPPAGTSASGTLNISIKSTSVGTGTPTYCAAYTTNGGVTWTQIGLMSNTQSTLTATGITSISGLGLMIGCQTTTSSNSTCTLTVYDVWLVWTYSPGYFQYGYPTEIGLVLFDERWRNSPLTGRSN